MRVLIDIQDDKASFVLEVLKHFSFVKTEPLTDEKELLIEEIKEAVENMKLVKEGKLKARPVIELLDGL